jgi:hypothetical protein
MAEDRHVLREIAWSEVCPCTSLFSAWKVAINHRALILAAVGVLMTWIGFRTLDRMFGVEPASFAASNFAIVEPIQSADVLATSPLGWWVKQSPLTVAWVDLSRPFRLLFDQSHSFRSYIHIKLCAIWALAVWAFFGGAITRLAAIELTREEKIGWQPLLSYTASKWPSYFIAPLFPLFGVLLALIPLFFVGLLLRAGGFGVVLGAILWPLVLVAGIVMAILLVGLLFNWPLMWPTISAEGTDSFDALSRSYAYTFQRPFRYLGYVVISAIVGLLAWLLVSLFAISVLRLSQWGIAWGSGNAWLADVLANNDLPRVARFGARLIGWCNAAVALLATGFIYSYFWSAMTAIYLLLRYHIDATEMDEVHLAEDDIHGLPPLANDSAGVPLVADAPEMSPIAREQSEG